MMNDYRGIDAAPTSDEEFEAISASLRSGRLSVQHETVLDKLLSSQPKVEDSKETLQAQLDALKAQEATNQGVIADLARRLVEKDVK